jgi:hypothetical protein
LIEQRYGYAAKESEEYDKLFEEGEIFGWHGKSLSIIYLGDFTLWRNTIMARVAQAQQH